MNFGETIKKIRTDKNMTQTQLSEGILARNHLSQVENNNYFPSYDRVFMLLDRLNVTFEEFLFVQNDLQPHDKQQFRVEISDSANLHNLEQLEHLSKEADQLYESTSNIIYYHYSLLCKAVFEYGTDNLISEAMVQYVAPIKKYLLDMDNWYLYELKLFSSILFALEVEEAVFFSRKAFKRLHAFRCFMEYQHTEQHLYLNLSTLCLEHGDFKAAKDFAKTAIDTATTHRLIYEKVCSELNHAIACIRLGEGSEHYETIRKNMVVLDYLGFDTLHKHFMLFLKKYEIEVK
ncbi:helix-turn-helix domain-containing protein [Listeria booriae]|uniref:helix-turn-helix domain-containing protein n=1 Tax=Listeria booriae TaxID=1552123 RepID=UPI00162A38F4|nr:Rgg/GadR/MutR family transcriptional regulator [Listeria booriae]MBC2174573.1 helix-turn-helix domain-containing protein [Listeria booriae]MBC2180517.1 helix-turn-helix domain-containing protein [Listeria booriae]